MFRQFGLHVAYLLFECGYAVGTVVTQYLCVFLYFEHTFAALSAACPFVKQYLFYMPAYIAGVCFEFLPLYFVEFLYSVCTEAIVEIIIRKFGKLREPLFFLIL